MTRGKSGANVLGLLEKLAYKKRAQIYYGTFKSRTCRSLRG